MKVYRNIEDYAPVQNAVVTIGTFDGVHTGHKAIITRVKQIARETSGESVIITFHPHPQIVLHPGENIFVLNTDEEKINLLKGIGIDHLIIIPFTGEFASVSYLDFIKEVLIGKLHVRKLVIGYDHHFGKNREGDLRHLVNYGKQYHFEVDEIKAQKVDDVAVSSTKIRKALMGGDIRAANHFLGYPYFLSGKVVEGNNLGQSMEFPTANIDVKAPYKLIPANGAYAVEVEIKKEKFWGMLNIGMRPTINGSKRVIEVNIFNFNKNIYSAFLNVSFIEKLRDEIKFNGLEHLKEQLFKDRENAIKILDEKESL
ncbi:MAG: bifunctional riboflavin kinase/FAD synthetase [Bacteroidales bacterium]